MISSQVALKAVGMLSLMKFFPSDAEARAALAELLSEMCGTDEQVLWLARRTRNLYREWPGANELRAVFCTKFNPRDGINADSGVFLDGIPSEAGEWERRNRHAEALPGGASSLDAPANTLIAQTARGLKALPPVERIEPKRAEADLTVSQKARKERKNV